jgi:radical SAM-linked protein
LEIPEKERKRLRLSQKWAIELSVQGDLRFLSHHDMMRAMERLVCRANLPLKYSQGFNPRPALSLAVPRPVGVASKADLLVLALEQDLQAPALLESINHASPPAGLRATRAFRLEKAAPRPKSARYELPLAPERLPAVRARLDELAAQASWPVERSSASKDRSGRDIPSTKTQIDLRQLIRDLRLDGDRLQITLTPRGDVWARPAEVLTLLGLDGRVDLAALVREEVDYASPDESKKEIEPQDERPVEPD